MEWKKKREIKKKKFLFFPCQRSTEKKFLYRVKMKLKMKAKTSGCATKLFQIWHSSFSVFFLFFFQLTFGSLVQQGGRKGSSQNLKSYNRWWIVLCYLYATHGDERLENYFKYLHARWSILFIAPTNQLMTILTAEVKVHMNGSLTLKIKQHDETAWR